MNKSIITVMIVTFFATIFLQAANAADMTKETLQSMGIFNYDPAYFATVTGGSTTPTDRGKGL